MEKEAKFIVPDRATFERIQVLDQVGPYARKDTTVKHVTDRYVDTPDRSFASHHFYMRLRAGRRGKGSTLVTLKSTEAQPEGAVFSRDEYQLKVKDLDSATWPEGEVRNMVEQIGGGQPLTEVVTITQTRQVSILYEGERAVAEMSLDEVKIPTQGEPVKDYELEVEMLPGGLDADLRTLTRILAEDFNLIPQPLSKFERAL